MTAWAALRAADWLASLAGWKLSGVWDPDQAKILRILAFNPWVGAGLKAKIRRILAKAEWRTVFGQVQNHVGF